LADAPSALRPWAGRRRSPGLAADIGEVIRTFLDELIAAGWSEDDARNANLATWYVGLNGPPDALRGLNSAESAGNQPNSGLVFAASFCADFQE
jgi:hypothetical protein